jgi:very-short-patch-repair endonuclease
VEAAVLAYPGAWASHESAARLLGLPTIDPRVGDAERWPTVHVTRPGAARRDDWLVVHGCDAPSRRIVLLDGLAATDVVRTTIELSSTRSLRRAVAFIDAGMRLALSTGPGDTGLRALVLDSEARRRVRIAWREALAPYAGHRWVTRVRTAVDWADPAAESVLESLSRAELIQAGLPRPRCGAPVLGDDGRTYYADVLWDEERVIGEADGLAKYGGVAALVDEKRRQEALEAAGWTVVRWGWREGVTHPEVMIGRVRRALQARRRAAS